MHNRFLPAAVVIVVLSGLLACTSSNEKKAINPAFMRNISEFRMDTSALHDGEQIEVLCASDQLFPSDKVDYYVHVVAVSRETGDTVNIFATAMMQLNGDNRMTEFHSAETEMAKIYQNLNNVKSGSNVKDLKSNQFSKVYSDPEFIALETRHFPSIVGLIGGEWSTTSGHE